jgi:transposase
MALRFEIVEKKAQGHSLLQISELLHLSYSTVRNIYHRYQSDGQAGLTPLYHHCGVCVKQGKAKLVKRAALWLKRLHPLWGAPLIRLQLKERYGSKYLSSERTMQRWFKLAGLYRVKTTFPPSDVHWACHVHDTWQLDAKEQLRLKSGEKACYLCVVDEKSGALLAPFVFPPLPFQ